MFEYEWDGWLDERWLFLEYMGKKGKRERRMRKIPIVFGSCFFQGVAWRSIESEEGEEGEEDEELVSDSRQRMDEKPW